ncbi:MAG: hypothetical protein PHX18_05245 [Candidatus Gastranaerophilales bacterium]|nr:hypothetical protein [Candidatus Gastranaerophilales bacterium]
MKKLIVSLYIKKCEVMPKQNRKSKKNKKGIKSNPTIIAMTKQLEEFRTLKNIAGLFVETKELNSQFNDMEKQCKLLTKTPDAFNDIFIEHGWLAYGGMNLELMAKCVELAKNGNIDNANEELLNYFTDEQIKYHLQTIYHRDEAITKRQELLKMAYDDYVNNRYHSCIPIVLIIIDGIVCDVTPQQKSGESAEVTAWDSITGHSSSLQRIYSEIIHKSRKKTTTEKILLPYRNGILHGRDLGYANKIVAIKTWNVLFAIGDWVSDLKTEESRQKEFDKKFNQKPMSMLETLKFIEEHSNKMIKAKKNLEEWKAREFKSDYFPLEITENSIFDENSPEHSLKKFLFYWKSSKYGNLATSLYRVYDNNFKKKAGEFRKELEDKKYVSSVITNIVDEAPAIAEIFIDLWYQNGDKLITKDNIIVRMVYEDENNNPIASNSANGKWKIITNFLYALY